MLGNIIGIEENTVLVNLSVDLGKLQSLINLYVVMDDEMETKQVGEITDIKDNVAYINLLGEINNDRFTFGVIKKPSFKSLVKLISKERVSLIIGNEDFKENKDLYIGKSAIYDGVDISVNINAFFSHHFAVFGSTGSGKSCGIARILQNLFSKQEQIAYKSSIFIFDAYGEYHQAFSEVHDKVPDISFKSYTTSLVDDNEKLCIPLWFLTVDDLALLLDATSRTQLPIIEKALKLVTIFSRDEEIVIKHKNDIIARALLDILASGNPPAQIRDQVFSILSYYHTRDLNLETAIYQPGYTRPLKQCFLIDATGKIRDMELLTTFITSFLNDNLELSLPDGTFKYNLQDLEQAFDFALISEGVLKSDKVYDDCNTLKVRLHSLTSGEYNTYFNYPEYITKEQYIKKLITAPNGRRAQIVNFNINYVDDRFAKTITKIYSKILFDFAKSMKHRASLPFHIILEEAHRYVQNDNDVNLIGYNIFDRITKEGRKYGVILGLISQRPSELSSTALSQCNNFLIFRMLHPKDVEYIKEMVPNITNEVVKMLRILQPGNCIGFGLAFKVPIIIKLDMPSPAPASSSCDVSNIWFIEK